MDFELSEDQHALQAAASAVLRDHCSVARVRQVADTARQVDDDLWSVMAEQGWLAVALPASAGGLDLGLVEVAVLCEQVGRALAPVPFLGTVLAAGALARAVGDGDLAPTAPLGDADVGTWIDRMSSGHAVGALAWSSPPAAVAARPDGRGGWLCSGRPDLVVYGPAADVVMVFAECEGSALLCAVALDPADRPAAQPAMDRTRSLGWLMLEDRPALAVGGPSAASDLLDRAATAVSAEMLGAAERVLDMTVAYAKERVQFGRPIGSFQAVKHRCADMLVDVEGMRSATYYASWAVGAADPEAASAASVAKIWSSDAARRTMASALQVHGGVGFTWEHDLHLFLKRSHLDQLSFGDARFHRERLAAMLRPRAESGRPIL